MHKSIIELSFKIVQLPIEVPNDDLTYTSVAKKLSAQSSAISQEQV